MTAANACFAFDDEYNSIALVMCDDSVDIDIEGEWYECESENYLRWYVSISTNEFNFEVSHLMSEEIVGPGNGSYLKGVEYRIDPGYQGWVVRSPIGELHVSDDTFWDLLEKHTQ